MILVPSLSSWKSSQRSPNRTLTQEAAEDQNCLNYTNPWRAVIFQRFSELSFLSQQLKILSGVCSLAKPTSKTTRASWMEAARTERKNSSLLQIMLPKSLLSETWICCLTRNQLQRE